MRYASWAFVFVNTLLKSDAKIHTFSDAAKFIFIDFLFQHNI